MSAIQQPTVYDDLLELLAESADPQRLKDFRLSAEKQARLDELLEKNREGTLDEDDVAELDAYEHFEHVVRMLKARLLNRGVTSNANGAMRLLEVDPNAASLFVDAHGAFREELDELFEIHPGQ